MSLQYFYEKLDPHEKLDLAVVAANTALRKLLAQEVADLDDQLANMQTPASVVAGAQEFAIQYSKRAKQKLFLLELLSVLDTSLKLLTDTHGD